MTGHSTQNRSLMIEKEDADEEKHEFQSVKKRRKPKKKKKKMGKNIKKKSTLQITIIIYKYRFK